MEPYLIASETSWVQSDTKVEEGGEKRKCKTPHIAEHIQRGKGKEKRREGRNAKCDV